MQKSNRYSGENHIAVITHTLTLQYLAVVTGFPIIPSIYRNWRCRHISLAIEGAGGR